MLITFHKAVLKLTHLMAVTYILYLPYR